MNIQLTDYGISLLSTGEVFEAATFQLGNQYNYVPLQDATGIKGAKVYEGGVTPAEIISANVFKFQIGLDYGIGNFDFGEIALFDSTGQCLAVGVSSTLIHKEKVSANSYGNSIVLDVFLSMVAKNYTMWVDKLVSDNKFLVPILESVDSLEPVASADPNFYIIKGASEQQSSILAYTAKNGLWCFDAYDYANQRDGVVETASASSISFDVTGLTDEELESLSLNYFGEMILEFTTGEVYSICRYPQRVTISGTKCYVQFFTPLAIIPKVGDRFVIYCRRPIATTNLVLPTATEDTKGAVSVGAGLDITPSGVLSADVLSVNGKVGAVELKIDDPILAASKVAISGSYNDLLDIPEYMDCAPATNTHTGGFRTEEGGFIQVDPVTEVVKTAYTPVKSVSGAAPDASGVVNVNGLVKPTKVEGGDFNGYRKTGLFYGSAEALALMSNAPGSDWNEAWTLEVVPQLDAFESGSCIQRFHSANHLAFRAFSQDTNKWSPWVQVLSSANMPIASTTALGLIRIGAGLAIDGDGIVSADLKQDYLLEALKPFNIAQGLPLLTNTGDETIGGTDGTEMSGARLPLRQMTFGAMYYCGTWNARLNVVNGDSNQHLSGSGLIRYNIGTALNPLYKEWSPKGWLLEVTEAGEFDLDGQSSWQVGDVLFCDGSVWKLLMGRSLKAPTDSGVIVHTGNGSTKAVSVVGKAGGAIVVENPKGENGNITIDLSTEGFSEEGTYGNLTLDKYGRVKTVALKLSAGTY